MSTWADDLERSEMWVRDNEALIRRMLHAKRIFKCEGSGDGLKKHLDTRCGTDYFVEHENGETYAVGSRFQNDGRQRGRKWETFTIRESRDSGSMTEYKKLVRAIEADTQRPHLTMQGYIANGQIDRMAVAKTKDIVDYIQKTNPPTNHTGFDLSGQAWFYVIDWNDFKSRGFPIRIYRNGTIEDLEQ